MLQYNIITILLNLSLDRSLRKEDNTWRPEHKLDSRAVEYSPACQSPT